jgi:autotransporter translocation and assembly factor TamB
LIEVLSDKVLLGCGENTISQMTATGVSPTLVLANQLDCLTDKVKDVVNMVSIQKVELMAAWKESFEALPELVSNHIRDTLEITGAVNVTQADVIRIVSTAFELSLRIKNNTINCSSYC